MFLFTTPASPSPSATAVPAARPAGAEAVAQAIRAGAQRTGSDFDYLLRTAQRESALDPAARAKTSSATGLFQFIEQTWLRMVKAAGAQHGLGEAAAAIEPGRDGRLTVADAATRAEILALRGDPEISATMAGVLTQANRASLGASLGREPTRGELYAAHVLGAKGAADLIAAAATTPERPAAASFPEAAQANRGLFFERNGRARTVRELYAVLAAQPAAAPASGEVTAFAEERSLSGLFSNQRRSPVSEAVARLWATRTGPGRERLAALGEAPRYFPGASGVVTATDARAEPALATAAPAAEPAATAETPPATASAARRPKGGRRPAKPLDLNAFIRTSPRS